MQGQTKRIKSLRTATLVERWAWFAVGVFINAFGIALVTKAALGTSPISSLPYVLSLQFPLTLGEFTFVLNMIFILIQFAVLRRDFKPFQWLQIVVNLAFSSSLDLSMFLLSWLSPDNIVEQILALLVGCVALGTGVSIEVAPDVLFVPGEGMVRVIARTAKKRFGTCKIAFDATLVVISALLSFAFFGYLNGIGVGTVVSALLVGSVSNFVYQHLPLITHIEHVRDVSKRLRVILKRQRTERAGEGAAASASRGQASRVRP